MISFSRFTFSRRGVLSLLLGLIAGGFVAGCANTGGDYSYVTRIATGERMTFALKRGRPELAQSGTIRIRVTGLDRVPGKETMTAYAFGLEDMSGVVPKAIRVDDVSEKTIFPLVEDTKPELKNRFYWLGTSKPMDATAPELYWLPYLDDTTRVFRFTITTADDRQVVLYQAWIVPSFVKAGIRAALGIKN